MSKVKLTMFVAQISENMQALIKELDRTLNESFPGNYDLTIVNVLEMPEKAVEDGVFVTPTLIRSFPKPVLKILGDLSNLQAVLTKIELNNGEGQGSVII